MALPGSSGSYWPTGTHWSYTASLDLLLSIAAIILEACCRKIESVRILCAHAASRTIPAIEWSRFQVLWVSYHHQTNGSDNHDSWNLAYSGSILGEGFSWLATAGCRIAVIYSQRASLNCQSQLEKHRCLHSQWLLPPSANSPSEILWDDFLKTSCRTKQNNSCGQPNKPTLWSPFLKKRLGNLYVSEKLSRRLHRAVGEKR